jgi:hypothetical protein
MPCPDYPLTKKPTQRGFAEVTRIIHHVQSLYPPGFGGARDAKGAREATQTASFLVGVHNLLAASFGICIGGRILAAATPTGVTAILLFAVGSMPIALPLPHSDSGDSEG